MRTVSHWKTNLGTGELLGLDINGESFIFGLKQGHVRSFDWNGDMFYHQQMKQTRIFDIIRWLVPCRDTRDIYATMIKFVLN